LESTATMISKADNNYGVEKLKVLDGLDAVRTRPGWYLGCGTDSRGLHQCVYEIVDNSVDEALAGFCDEINIIIHRNGGCTVVDNGRGVPTGIHPEYKLSGVEIVYTKLHGGAKFNEEGGAYKVSGGLHGVGAAVVNALATDLEIEIRDGKNIHQMGFSQGDIVSPLKIVGKTTQTGTKVTFFPDASVFTTTQFNFNTLANRFREMAYLNKDLKLTLEDERTEKKLVFHYNTGLKGFIGFLNKKKETIHDPIYISQTKEEYEVEVALQWTKSYKAAAISSYANAIATTDGGTHVQGFKTAITRCLNSYIKGNNLAKNSKITGDDIREGLTAVISIKLRVLQFDSQKKGRLVNHEVEGIVNSLVGDGLKVFFEENPKVARTIVKKAVSAAAAREAAKRARDFSRKKTSLLGNSLPGKRLTLPRVCTLILTRLEGG